MQRRAFLGWTWKVGAGLIAAAGAWTTWDLLKPIATGGFGGTVRTIAEAAIPAEGVVEVPAARSYLLRVDNEVVAISEKCTHLGCRVPFCESSNQFECPCHGTVFNRAGDFLSGPAPRGMDRHPIEIGADGLIYIDTGSKEDGPPAGEITSDQPTTGPSCLEGGHG